MDVLLDRFKVVLGILLPLSLCLTSIRLKLSCSRVLGVLGNLYLFWSVQSECRHAVWLAISLRVQYIKDRVPISVGEFAASFIWYHRTLLKIVVQLRKCQIGRKLSHWQRLSSLINRITSRRYVKLIRTSLRWPNVRVLRHFFITLLVRFSRGILVKVVPTCGRLLVGEETPTGHPPIPRLLPNR